MTIALVTSAYASAGASGTGPATTSGIDTTGATLLVAVAAYYHGTSPTVSDSKGNTWHPLTAYDAGGGTQSCQIYYAYDHGGSALSVGSGHTFSLSTVGSGSPGIAVAAFSGTDATSAVYDATAGDVGTGIFSDATPSNAGSITPSADNSLVIAGMSASAIFVPTCTEAPILTYQQYSPSYGVALGSVVQTTAAAVNPTWSWSGGTITTGFANAVFKEAGGGGGATAVTLNGPSSGAIDAASTNFSVGVDATPITGTLRVTPATDISGGGSFNPAYLDLTTGSPSGTFQFTPAKSGVHSISCSDNGGLTDPPPVDYTVTPKVRLPFVVSPSNASPRANVTSIKWAWWDVVSPASFGAPVNKGSTESTDASGIIDIPLPDSTLTNGEVGWLVATDSDGTTTQTPPGRSFCGPAAVT